MKNQVSYLDSDKPLIFICYHEILYECKLYIPYYAHDEIRKQVTHHIYILLFQMYLLEIHTTTNKSY
jgi:hypothetical protein